MERVEVTYSDRVASNVAIIGCGGAGKNIMAISTEGRKIAIDSVQPFDLRADVDCVAIAAGKDADLAKFRFARELSERIRDADLVFIVAGLGGITGGKASIAAARVCRSVGVPVIASVSMPFEVEGSVRRAEGRKQLIQLERAASLTVPFENSIINRNIPDFTLSRALDVMNRIVLTPVEEISFFADQETIPLFTSSPSSGFFTVEYSSGIDWERKGAAALKAVAGEQMKRFRRIHIFLTLNEAQLSSPELLGEEVASLSKAEHIDVWVRRERREGQNRIAFLGMKESE